MHYSTVVTSMSTISLGVLSTGCGAGQQVQSAALPGTGGFAPGSLSIRHFHTTARLRTSTLRIAPCGEEEDKDVNFPVNFWQVIHRGVDNVDPKESERPIRRYSWSWMRCPPTR